ncbi:CapA family protein [Thermoactinomyces sp. DSM 45892]|uniref:CapA family protein n=1 Tax=Thermoactinomyces sp. DSM 45892 TaxID=1882753 RepID=UPI000896DA4D|nr:CapA family protein [Thermoactinomyces sp. DSM 45892]SDY99359.1 poly-gamma-glutamate synthesis protein (capsule biosynthesis protein) [Thermoactinomyces sp. DSM 45892]
MKRIISIITAILTVILFVIFFPFGKAAISPESNSDLPSKSEQKETAPSKLQIAAFGDIMMHTPQIKAGALGGNNYDFRSFFKEVKPYISQADIAIGNFEMTLAGPSKPYSGFPQFNAPDQIVDALKDSGVDVVSTSNNHAMDTGADGAIRTHKVVNERGIKTTGTSPSAEKRKPLIVEKNGIKVAFLAYTELTNGIPVPSDKPYLVNLIGDGTGIAKDIAQAKKEGAELVCVSLHWGVEYQRKPNESQKSIAEKVFKAGADVIFGSHPHVLQPMEKMNVDGKEKYIIYSMGNFVSNQKDPYTDEGIIVYVDLEKDPKTNEVKLKKFSFLPTFVYKYNANGKQQYAIIPTPTQEATSLPYPGLSASKWKSVWNNTVSHVSPSEAIPVYANPAQKQ